MPLAIGILLAADPPPAKADANRELFFTGMLLVGALLILALVVAVAQRWYRRMTTEQSSAESLGSFRQSFERGELTEEEYKRILNRMGGAKLRSPARPSTPTHNPEPPPSEGQTPESPAAE
ncbi:MAG: hypothetical protein ACJ8C4_11890 [Gemmataceae bacterium]